MERVREFIACHYKTCKNGIERLTELKTDIENGKEDAKLMEITNQLLERSAHEIKILETFLDVCYEKEAELNQCIKEKGMVHVTFENYVKEKIGVADTSCLGEVMWRLRELFYELE